MQHVKFNYNFLDLFILLKFMLKIFINTMGWISVVLIFCILIYAFTLKCIAKDEEEPLLWRHAFWYAIFDAFLLAKILKMIEPPKNESIKQNSKNA